MTSINIEDMAFEDVYKKMKGTQKPPVQERNEPDFIDVGVPPTAPAGKVKMYSEITGSVPAGLEDFAIPCYDDADWEKEDRQFIPDVDSTFVWDHTVAYPLLKAYVHGLKALIVGPTGSGKTETNKQIAGHLRQPYLRINGRQDMEADTLLGKPWVSNGNMEFKMGDLPKAMLKGWYIAFDEPWKTPAGIQMALQRFYERNGVLQLDDMPGSLEDKTIVPSNKMRLVLCDNVVGSGDNMDVFGATLIQDASTINRMDVVLFQDYLQMDDEVKLLTGKYNFLPESKAKMAVQLANAIRRAFASRDISATMSPRNLQSWMELAYDLKSYKLAFTYVMLNRFADDAERVAVKGMWTQVYGDQL